MEVEAALARRQRPPLGGVVHGVVHGLRQRGDRSPDASTSNTSLVTMPPTTTASLKTHSGHGGHSRDKSADSSGRHRPRHHSGGYARRSSTRVNCDIDHPGITTPVPVQQSSEVSNPWSLNEYPFYVRAAKDSLFFLFLCADLFPFFQDVIRFLHFTVHYLKRRELNETENRLL